SPRDYAPSGANLPSKTAALLSNSGSVAQARGRAEMHVARRDRDAAPAGFAHDKVTGVVDRLEDAPNHVAVALHRDLGAESGSRIPPARDDIGRALAISPKVVALDPVTGQHLEHGFGTETKAQRGKRGRRIGCILRCGDDIDAEADAHGTTPVLMRLVFEQDTGALGAVRE